eukprot:COSAG03_NODE_10412_length_652_cov_1.826401_2_plen_53_part_00
MPSMATISCRYEYPRCSASLIKSTLAPLQLPVALLQLALLVRAEGLDRQTQR